MVLNPGVREYVFKHLHSNTEYSFAVQPMTKIGGSQSFSDPVAQFTGPGVALFLLVIIFFNGCH